MATPTYNSAGLNLLTPLVFSNGGMDGCLATTGNTVTVEAGCIKSRYYQAAPAGASYSSQRVIGVPPRRVTWNVHLCTIADEESSADENMNTVEAAIEEYITDGRGYEITDGKGRTGTNAVIVSEATERVGPRMPLHNGGRSQNWRIVFSVLEPRVGSLYL